MARPKRLPIQRERDLRTIARMYLRGYHQDEIAKRIEVSGNQISYDIKDIKRRWLKSTLIDFNERMGAELEKIDQIEREYIEGYKRSKKRKITKTRKQVPLYKNPEGNLYVDVSGELKEEKQIIRSGELVTEENIKTELRDGDPRWLDGIQQCIDKRCKIFGLYRTTSQDGGQGTPQEKTGDLKAQIAIFLSIFEELGE